MSTSVTLRFTMYLSFLSLMDTRSQRQLLFVWEKLFGQNFTVWSPGTVWLCRSAKTPNPDTTLITLEFTMSLFSRMRGVAAVVCQREASLLFGGLHSAVAASAHLSLVCLSALLLLVKDFFIDGVDYILSQPLTTQLLCILWPKQKHDTTQRSRGLHSSLLFVCHKLFLLHWQSEVYTFYHLILNQNLILTKKNTITHSAGKNITALRSRHYSCLSVTSFSFYVYTSYPYPTF